MLKMLKPKHRGAVAEVGYTAPYALAVHEDMEMFHFNGQAKYLETAWRTVNPGPLVRKAVEEGTPFEDAVKMAADAVLELSQQLVPVATGALRDSGYVEITE